MLQDLGLGVLEGNNGPGAETGLCDAAPTGSAIAVYPAADLSVGGYVKIKAVAK
jgi:hypothetical protein